MACNEVPLVVNQESASTKLYDSADLLAEGRGAVRGGSFVKTLEDQAAYS